MLARNHRLIASFSRALTEGLTVDQTDAEFDAKLEANIDEIYARIGDLIEPPTAMSDF